MWDDLLRLPLLHNRRLAAARSRRWRTRHPQRARAAERRNRKKHAALWRKGGKYYETRIRQPGYHEYMARWQREYRAELSNA